MAESYAIYQVSGTAPSVSSQPIFFYYCPTAFEAAALTAIGIPAVAGEPLELLGSADVTSNAFFDPNTFAALIAFPTTISTGLGSVTIAPLTGTTDPRLCVFDQLGNQLTGTDLSFTTVSEV